MELLGRLRAAFARRTAISRNTAGIRPKSERADFLQTVRKLAGFGAVRNSGGLGLVGYLRRPERPLGGFGSARVWRVTRPQAAIAAIIASTPRMLNARRRL